MHPMRRKDKERDAAFAWQVLRDATYATLAMTLYIFIAPAPAASGTS